MNQLPRWYVPKGKPTPPHLAALPPCGLLDGVGPDAVHQIGDGLPATGGGGVVIGGSFAFGDPGWVPVNGGAWLINLAGVEPQTLSRLNPHPRILRWVPVQGSQRSHWWNVPVLLTPEMDDAGNAVLYRSALDQAWNGTTWVDPADLAGLQERLRHVALDVAGGLVNGDAELVALVAEILLLGTNLQPGELSASGWLTRSFLLRVLLAAADIPLERAHG